MASTATGGKTAVMAVLVSFNIAVKAATPSTSNDTNAAAGATAARTPLSPPFGSTRKEALIFLQLDAQMDHRVHVRDYARTTAVALFDRPTTLSAQTKKVAAKLGEVASTAMESALLLRTLRSNGLTEASSVSLSRGPIAETKDDAGLAALVKFVSVARDDEGDKVVVSHVDDPAKKPAKGSKRDTPTMPAAAPPTSNDAKAAATMTAVAGKEGIIVDASASSASRGDVCRDATTCATCDKAKGCGWCDVRGVCVKGDQLGPLEMSCQIWSFGECGGPRCGSTTRCGDCIADVQCGWCEERCACMERRVNHPHTGPMFGSCPKGWLVDEPPSSRCPAWEASRCGSKERDADMQRRDDAVSGLGG